MQDFDNDIWDDDLEYQLTAVYNYFVIQNTANIAPFHDKIQELICKIGSHLQGNYGAEYSESFYLFSNKTGLIEKPAKSFTSYFLIQQSQEDSYGLEALYKAIKDMKAKRVSSAGDGFYFITFIGEEFDNSIDREKILSEILQLSEQNSPIHIDFYKLNINGESCDINEVGSNMDGAIKMFDVSDDEMDVLKNILFASDAQYRARVIAENRKRERERISKAYFDAQDAIQNQKESIKALIESKGFLDMIEMPDNAFEVSGCVFRSAEELAKQKVASLDYTRNGSWISPSGIYVNEYGLYVFEYFRRYPCFDSYDYASENRYYQLFIISDSLEEAQKKFAIITYLGDISLKMPAIFGPIVYYDTGIPCLKVSHKIIAPDTSILDKILEEITVYNRMLESEEYLKLKEEYQKITNYHSCL